jgi:hypothetical protein
MLVDVNPIVVWVSLILSIVTLAGMLKTWLSSGEKEIDERLGVAEKTLINHDRRVQTVESELKHLPDKDMVMDLKLAMAELKGTVSTLGETVGSVSRTVHRIDDYLREDTKQ